MTSSGSMTPSVVTIHAFPHNLRAAFAQLATLIQEVTGALWPVARLGLMKSTPPELKGHSAQCRVGNA
jgi:hypothetical protein